MRSCRWSSGLHIFSGSQNSAIQSSRRNKAVELAALSRDAPRRPSAQYRWGAGIPYFPGEDRYRGPIASNLSDLGHKDEAFAARGKARRGAGAYLVGEAGIYVSRRRSQNIAGQVFLVTTAVSPPSGRFRQFRAGDPQELPGADRNRMAERSAKYLGGGPPVHASGPARRPHAAGCCPGRRFRCRFPVGSLWIDGQSHPLSQPSGNHRTLDMNVSIFFTNPRHQYAETRKLLTIMESLAMARNLQG